MEVEFIQGYKDMRGNIHPCREDAVRLNEVYIKMDRKAYIENNIYVALADLLHISPYHMERKLKPLDTCKEKVTHLSNLFKEYVEM